MAHRSIIETPLPVEEFNNVHLLRQEVHQYLLRVEVHRDQEWALLPVEAEVEAVEIQEVLVQEVEDKAGIK